MRLYLHGHIALKSILECNKVLQSLYYNFVKTKDRAKTSFPSTHKVVWDTHDLSLNTMKSKSKSLCSFSSVCFLSQVYLYENKKYLSQDPELILTPESCSQIFTEFQSF